MMVARSNSAKTPEHLHHHPSGRRRGLEGLGGRAEGHVYLIQLFDDLGQLLDAARDPIHPVDEQQVESSRLGLAQGSTQSRTIQGGARALIGEARHELPSPPFIYTYDSSRCAWASRE